MNTWAQPYVFFNNVFQRVYIDSVDNSLVFKINEDNLIVVSLNSSTQTSPRITYIFDNLEYEVCPSDVTCLTGSSMVGSELCFGDYGYQLYLQTESMSNIARFINNTNIKCRIDFKVATDSKDKIKIVAYQKTNNYSRYTPLDSNCFFPQPIDPLKIPAPGDKPFFRRKSGTLPDGWPVEPNQISATPSPFHKQQITNSYNSQMEDMINNHNRRLEYLKNAYKECLEIADQADFVIKNG